MISALVLISKLQLQWMRSAGSWCECYPTRSICSPQGFKVVHPEYLFLFMIQAYLRRVIFEAVISAYCWYLPNSKCLCTGWSSKHQMGICKLNELQLSCKPMTSANSYWGTSRIFAGQCIYFFIHFKKIKKFSIHWHILAIPLIIKHG